MKKTRVLKFVVAALAVVTVLFLTKKPMYAASHTGHEPADGWEILGTKENETQYRNITYLQEFEDTKVARVYLNEDSTWTGISTQSVDFSPTEVYICLNGYTLTMDCMIDIYCNTYIEDCKSGTGQRGKIVFADDGGIINEEYDSLLSIKDCDIETEGVSIIVNMGEVIIKNCNITAKGNTLRNKAAIIENATNSVCEIKNSSFELNVQDKSKMYMYFDVDFSSTIRFSGTVNVKETNLFMDMFLGGGYVEVAEGTKMRQLKTAFTQMYFTGNDNAADLRNYVSSAVKEKGIFADYSDNWEYYYADYYSIEKDPSIEDPSVEATGTPEWQWYTGKREKRAFTDKDAWGEATLEVDENYDEKTKEFIGVIPMADVSPCVEFFGISINFANTRLEVQLPSDFTASEDEVLWIEPMRTSNLGGGGLELVDNNSRNLPQTLWLSKGEGNVYYMDNVPLGRYILCGTFSDCEGVKVKAFVEKMYPVKAIKGAVSNRYESDTAGTILCVATWNKGKYNEFSAESGSIELAGFKVNFDSQGGSEVESQFKVKDGLVDEPEVPVKNSYDFTGWFKDKDCTAKWDFAKDKVTGDTTLYAGWKLKFVVTYKDYKKYSGKLIGSLDITQKKGAICFKFAKIDAADGYDIFGSYCGGKLLANVDKVVLQPKDNKKFVKTEVTEIDGAKLNEKVNVKFIIKAYKKISDTEKVYIGETLPVHIVGRRHKQYVNATGIKLENKKGLTLKKGQKVKINATVSKGKTTKKLLPRRHGEKVRLFSTDEDVAKVTTIKKVPAIKAVGNGSCEVYAVTLNGKSVKINVTVGKKSKKK